jgi:hypothetical protein
VRRFVLTFAAALVLALAVAGPASAQPPWYADGPGGRILFDDSWLYRADPTDAGLAEGWASQADVEGRRLGREHGRLGRLVPA